MINRDRRFEQWILRCANNNQRSTADARCDEDRASARSAQHDAGFVHAELSFDLKATAGEQHCAAKAVFSCGTIGDAIERALNKRGVVAA